MLASDILSDARYTLSDTAKTRWTDARLLALLNDALIDIAKNTSIFVENIFYVVQDLVVDIDMSDFILKTLRVEYLDEPIPFYSFEEMDAKYGSLWQHDTGTKVLAIVYDKQRNGIFKQYPIVENAQNQYIEYNSLYGITTDISYSDILPLVGGSYGDLAPIPPEALLKFYYVRRHAKLTAITDTLYIDDLIRTPLAKYVTGMALRDNQDAQNRAMGNEELKFYYAMVEEYSIQKSEVYVRAQHEVRYRPND